MFRTLLFIIVITSLNACGGSNNPDKGLKSPCVKVSNNWEVS